MNPAPSTRGLTPEMRALRSDASPLAAEPATVRKVYTTALRRADDGDVTPLYDFVRR